MEFLEPWLASKAKATALLIVLVFLVYLPVWRGPFLLDDTARLEVLSNTSAADLLMHSNLVPGAAYEPTAWIFHQGLIRIAGTQPTLYHLCSIGIHAFNAVLLFWVLGLFGVATPWALASALLFGIHPLQTEAVSYISLVGLPLALCFMLISIVAWNKYLSLRKTLWLIITFAAMVLAVGAHPMAILSGLILWAIFRSQQNAAKKKEINPDPIQYAPLIMALLLFGVWLAIPSVTSQAEIPISLQQRIITCLTWFPRELGWIVFPVYQFFDHPSVVFTAFKALSMGGLMILMAIGYLVVEYRKSAPLVSFGLLCFLLFWVPYVVFLQPNQPAREHQGYLGLAAVCLVFATLMIKAQQKAPMISFWITIGFLSVYSLKSIYRNNQWADPLRFYRNEINYNKNSATSYHQLGSVLRDRGDFTGAMSQYSHAMAIDNQYPQLHHDIAEAYLLHGELSNAMASEYQALALQPAYLPALISLRDIYRDLHDDNRKAHFETFISQTEKGITPSKEEIQSNLHAEKP